MRPRRVAGRIRAAGGSARQRCAYPGSIGERSSPKGNLIFIPKKIEF